jgi:hypothetical protein
MKQRNGLRAFVFAARAGGVADPRCDSPNRPSRGRSTRDASEAPVELAMLLGGAGVPRPSFVGAESLRAFRWSL